MCVCVRMITSWSPICRTGRVISSPFRMRLLLGANWHSSAVKQIAGGVSGYSLLLPCRVWFHWQSNFQVNVETRKVQFLLPIMKHPQSKPLG